MNRWYQRIMMLAVIVSAASPALAQEPPNCLVEAENSFRNMRLSKTIEVLNACREAEWPRLDLDQRIAAFRLLSLSHFARREPQLAEEAVRGLLAENRRYQPDPLRDPQFFKGYVRKLRPRRWYQRRDAQVAGALLVASAVGCFLAGCFTSEPGDLPGPGDFFPGTK